MYPNPEIPKVRRRESGAALLVAMLLLTAMALIGFASLNTVMRYREATGYTSQSQGALQGADAAIAHGLDVLRNEVLSNAVNVGTCLTGTVPVATLPDGVTYGPDATAPSSSICVVAQTEPCNEMGKQSLENSPGGAHWKYAVWNFRTQGVSPGGATARVQAAALRCVAFTSGGY